MSCATRIIVFLLLALPLTSCASTTMTLYSGEMELVTLSGSGCLEKETTGSRIPLELTLGQGSPSNDKEITGYFNGPGIQSGHFFGNDLDRLHVVYPDEPGPSQGHTLVLSHTPEEANGELHEKPQADSANCYFEKAVLKLKQEATGSKATSVYYRLSKLFSAEAYYIRGQTLLKADKPEEAILDLTKSLNFRNMVNPEDPDRAYSVISIAIAHIMAGRETEALALLRDLLEKRAGSKDAIIKQRMVASVSLCNDEQFLESDAGQKAAIQLMDIAAREFGNLDGVAVPLAACYYEMGMERKEQEDPDSAIEYFQKALKLNPDNPDSITGIVISHVDRESPAEGRKYLNDHSQSYIKMSGKEPYDALLSYIYVAEAQQEEINGELHRAEQLLREAIKARPGERALLIKLTRVLGKEGKRGEARELLENGTKGCADETCRKEYADESARQDLIERMVQRLETQTKMH